MSIVHQSVVHRQEVIACAQAGCPHCLNVLVRRHEGLVHAVLQRTHRCGVPYADLVQEGRIALWRAVCCFDPERGVAFSTYAWVAIRRRLQRAIGRATRPPGYLMPTSPVDPLTQVLEQEWHNQLGSALGQALAHLPPRLCRVIVVAYGLDGQPPRSLAAIGRQEGISGERVRQLRNDALVFLRLPALAAPLHQLCDQNTRSVYARLQTLNRAWLRRRRGRGTL